jgi:hypothetical protein
MIAIKLQESVRAVLALSTMLGACNTSSTVGTVTPIASLGGKSVDLQVSWDQSSQPQGQMTGYAYVKLSFGEVGQMLGSACPIVNADATFMGTRLHNSSHGGAMQCAVNDERSCGLQCLDVEWEGDLSASANNLPVTSDLVIGTSVSGIVATMQYPALMGEVTLVGLTSGGQLLSGSTFEVQLAIAPPSAATDLGFSFGTALYQGPANWILHCSQLQQGDPGVWSVNAANQDDPIYGSIKAGPATLGMGFAPSQNLLDSCPSDIVCTGHVSVGLADVPVVYVP